MPTGIEAADAVREQRGYKGDNQRERDGRAAKRDESQHDSTENIQLPHPNSRRSDSSFAPGLWSHFRDAVEHPQYIVPSIYGGDALAARCITGDML